MRSDFSLNKAEWKAPNGVGNGTRFDERINVALYSSLLSVGRRPRSPPLKSLNSRGRTRQAESLEQGCLRSLPYNVRCKMAGAGGCFFCLSCRCRASVPATGSAPRDVYCSIDCTVYCSIDCTVITSHYQARGGDSATSVFSSTVLALLGSLQRAYTGSTGILGTPPRLTFQARLLHNQEGANAEKGGYRKVSSKAFFNRRIGRCSHPLGCGAIEPEKSV